MFQRSSSTYSRPGVLVFMALTMLSAELYASSVPLLNTKRVPRALVSNTRTQLPQSLSRRNLALLNHYGRVQSGFGRGGFTQAIASAAPAFVPVVRSFAPPMPNLMPLISLLSQGTQVAARPTGNVLKAIAALGKKENAFEGFEGSDSESPELPQANPAEMPGGAGGGGGGPNGGGGPQGGPNSGQGNGQHNQKDPNGQRPIDPNANNNDLSHGLGPGSIDENGNFQGEAPDLNFGNVGNGHIDPDALENPTYEGRGVNGLVMSGENGNPGWQYQVEDGNARHGCQATLVSKKSGVCVAATASHCLAEAVSHQQAYNDDKMGAVAARLTMHTGDYGKIDAVAYVNPYYIDGGIEDSAAFVFKCGDEIEVPVVPLCKDYVSPGGTPVKYGKVMGKKQGFYSGITNRDPAVTAVNGFAPGAKQVQVYQYETPIQQGDSGGPLVVDQKGAACVAGVLSTKEPGTRYSNYAANESLQFIQNIVNTTEQKSQPDPSTQLADEGTGKSKEGAI